MVAEITTWVKNLVFVVLFASFLELLLPNNNMQRFVRVIMGLFIMLAILNPVLDIVQKRGSLEQLPVMGYKKLDVSDFTTKSDGLLEERNRIAMELYKKDVAKQIRATIMAIDGVGDANVKVDLRTGGTGIFSGTIDKITLHVKPGLTVGNQKVPRIVAGTEESGELEAHLKNKVIQTIVSLYQLRSEQIELKRMN